MFAGVESLLNSRPLTYQSSDPRPLTISYTAKWGDSSHLSPLKPLLCIRVNDGERPRTLFHECGGDDSRNVFLPLTAVQSGLQNSET